MSDSSDSESSSERSERLNNDGQEDGSKTCGRYNPPHNTIDTFFSFDIIEKSKDNDDYNAGFNNARDQKK